MVKRFKGHVEKVVFVPKEKKESALEKYGYEIPSDAKCTVCGISVTDKNLGAITRREAKIIVVCNKDECIAKSKLFIDIGG